MTLQELALAEKLARTKLERVSAMVQAQGLLQRDDPLKYTYDQMTVLFDRLDEAREAHDRAYLAWDEVA